MSFFSKREKKLITVTCFGHFMCHYNMLTFPAVVLPLAARLDLPMARVLGISFWMYLLFGLTALPWGIIGDRWGARRLMVIFFLGAGTGGLSAAAFLDSPIGLSASLAVVGLFSGIYHPIGLGMISKGVQRLSLALGYNGMFGNLGLALAPLIAGLANWLWGPKAAFVIIGILNLGGAIWTARLPAEETVASSAVKPVSRNNGRIQAFGILLVAMMLGGIIYRGGTLVLPAYFELKNQQIQSLFSTVDSALITRNLEATIITSVVFLIGMIGQYAGGKAAERFEPRWCYLLFHASALPMAFLMAITANLPLVAAALIYFFFLLGMQPIENTLVARFTPKRFHHSAFGMKFVLTFGVGALAVKIVEFIESAFSLEAVFVTLGSGSIALVTVIAALIVFTAPLARQPHSA